MTLLLLIINTRLLMHVRSFTKWKNVSSEQVGVEQLAQRHEAVPTIEFEPTMLQFHGKNPSTTPPHPPTYLPKSFVHLFCYDFVVLQIHFSGKSACPGTRKTLQFWDYRHWQLFRIAVQTFILYLNKRIKLRKLRKNLNVIYRTLKIFAIFHYQMIKIFK